jgi:hypothetical protein
MYSPGTRVRDRQAICEFHTAALEKHGTLSLGCELLECGGESLKMKQRLMAVLAICLGLTSGASAGEQSGILRRASCTLVRFYVAKYSATAAEQWARSNGATDAEIEAARRCLTSETTRTAKAQTKPVALGSYGW